MDKTSRVSSAFYIPILWVRNLRQRRESCLQSSCFLKKKLWLFQAESKNEATKNWGKEMYEQKSYRFSSVYVIKETVFYNIAFQTWFCILKC